MERKVSPSCLSCDYRLTDIPLSFEWWFVYSWKSVNTDVAAVLLPHSYVSGKTKTKGNLVWEGDVFFGSNFEWWFVYSWKSVNTDVAAVLLPHSYVSGKTKTKGNLVWEGDVFFGSNRIACVDRKSLGEANRGIQTFSCRSNSHAFFRHGILSGSYGKNMDGRTAYFITAVWNNFFFAGKSDARSDIL